MRQTFFLWLLLSIQPFLSFCQSEGWSSSCHSNLPTVAEVMIDAYGTDEFYTEYMILRVGDQPFNLRNLNFKVLNPTNNAFIGSVKVEDNSVNGAALTRLTAAVGNSCPYGAVFRDVFSEPYFGIVPPHSAILLFNNKDSVDLSFIQNNAFSSLCGSKVFTAFGTIKTQSPGVSIFRNHPRNGSCGTTGCLRQIQIQFEGNNAPFCQQITYDIKNLPHLNTSNPPDGYGDGSYIRTAANGIVNYGGGNLTGNGVPMPPLSMMCIIPPQPNFGAGFWNVSVFEGANNFTNFKGFYQAKGNHEPSVPATTGSFEYNSARDGWKPNEAASEAHPTYGALSAYDGCNVQVDNFSTIAKRRGFPCGDYALRLINYDDFVRIRIDTNGDGTWEFDKSYNAPACLMGCNTDIWQGTLNSDSKMEISGYDISKSYKTHLLFNKKSSSPSPIQIKSITTPSTICNTATGSINLLVSGGVSPYKIAWTGATSIANDVFTATNLLSGTYKTTATDSKGCRDSAQILVPQLNNLKANAGNDTAYCAGGIAILRGSSNLANNSFEWSTLTGLFISNQPIINVSPSISTKYVLKINDNNNCFATDTVEVKVNNLPYLNLTISTPDTICNEILPTLKVQGAQNYIWSSFPQIAGAALSSRTGDSVVLFTILLPAPQYVLKVEGTDANGCKNTAQTTLVIIPLPNATIKPVNDTLCADGQPRILETTPISGGRFHVEDRLGKVIQNAVVNSMFYPRTSGVGKFTVYYEIINAQGCKINPAIEINVKSCTICPLADTTKIVNYSCDPSVVGIKTTVLQNRNGCDSVVVSNTIFSKKDTVIVEKKTCIVGRIGQTIEKFTNQNGCDSFVFTRTFLKSSDIEFDITLSKSISCVGKNDGAVEIKMLKGGTPQYRLRWSNGDSSMTIKNLKTGIYKLSITDVEGCQTIDSIQLKEPTPLSIEAVGMQPQCLGDEYGMIRFNSVKNGAAPYQFFIDGQNKPINSLPFTLQNIRIGQHNLKILDKNNCQIDTTIQVKEGRKLEIDLGSNLSIVLGDSLSLNASFSLPIKYAKWTPSENINCDSCIPTVVKPLKTTTYKLTVRDSVGCQASDEMTVFVEKQRQVFIPTSFSPNDDKINDIFMIYADNEVSQIKTFQIFNRWGIQVFEANNFQPNDITNGWDGMFQNKALMPDVFIYYAIVEYKDGKSAIFQGDVTLLK